VLTLAADAPLCYCTIYHINLEGKFKQVFPNGIDARRQLQAGDTLRVPAGDWKDLEGRSNGLYLSIDGNCGEEVFVAIVSGSKLRKVSSTISMGAHETEEWLKEVLLKEGTFHCRMLRVMSKELEPLVKEVRSFTSMHSGNAMHLCEY
jgi:hypothetical protein